MAGAGAGVRGRVYGMSVEVGAVSRVYGDGDTLWPKPKRGLV